MDEGEFTYFVLLQFHPKEDVDAAFAAICDFAMSRQEETEGQIKQEKESKEEIWQIGIAELISVIEEDSFMKQQSFVAEKDAQPSQVDLEIWRILKKALQNGLSDRGVVVGDSEACLMTRFTLEHIEKSGLRVVPVKPTIEMQLAVKHALDKGKRMSISWVKQRAKQRWRYQAAIEAAPSWRRGYEHERNEAGGRHCHPEETGPIDDIPGRLADQPAHAGDNMDEVKLRDLNFKIHPDFHAKFKIAAAESGESMKDLLEECYNAWMKSRSASESG